ncbi:MAG TPA: polyprenyl diphosphate synthase [Thermoanaerobaculia bacterium]|nr:polyprenyl diphosphate synthase [Thermoanaerobaculia bacterium]
MTNLHPMDARSFFHVAIVMDGNGRWATARGLKRVEGHRRGADAVRRTVRAAPSLGITTLTLFAFSSDNWKRPELEVGTLLGLFGGYLRSEQAELKRSGVRLSVIGRRDRLPRSLVLAVEGCEAATASCSRLHLRIAIDYSAREAILRENIGPDVDLLVRTGGELRLSDFLLWESAYAELCFLPRMWPDFEEADLEAAVAEFHTRQRRFGGLPAEVPSRGRA